MSQWVFQIAQWLRIRLPTQEMLGQSLSGRSPGEGPIPVFLPEESYGQRSLTGYNPWGRKELNVTEHTCMLVSQFTMDLIGQHAISGWQ